MVNWRGLTEFPFLFFSFFFFFVSFRVKRYARSKLNMRGYEETKYIVSRGVLFKECGKINTRGRIKKLPSLRKRITIASGAKFNYSFVKELFFQIVDKCRNYEWTTLFIISVSHHECSITSIH